METNTGAVPATDLPTGVSQAPVVPATPQVEAVPATEVPPDAETMQDGGQVNTWKGSGLQILAGIVITTLAIFAIAYYRTKTLVVDDEIKDHGAKIRTLASDVEQIKTNTAA